MKITNEDKNVEIDLGKYVITGDSNCWTLFKVTKESKNPIGYFSTLCSLLKSIAERELKLCGAKSFKELLSESKRISLKIEDIESEINGDIK